MPTENKITAPEESAGVDFGFDGRSVRVSQEAYSIFLAREAAGREKIAALQQRLTAADERADVLEGLLRLAREFVNNGVELGYITMPDPETPDAAHDLVPKIDAALKPAEAARCANCDRATVEQCDDAGCGFLGAGNGAPE